MDNAENWMSPNEGLKIFYQIIFIISISKLQAINVVTENFIDCNDPDAPEKTMEMDEIQNPREHLKGQTFVHDNTILNYIASNICHKKLIKFFIFRNY